jgi:hypothetical protein
MLIGKTLPFVTGFVDEVNRALKRIDPDAGLTRIQKEWFGFCLLAIVVTNSVCWKRFERTSLGQRMAASLSWMFRQTTRCWRVLLQASVSVILARYGITGGVVVVDDSDKPRAKQTTRIYKAHKVKDKKSGGFINGQSVVLVLFVTSRVTIPVGVEFYMPDPALTAWNQADKALRKRGMPKPQRPAKPRKNPTYPTKPDIALRVLEEFHVAFPHLAVKCVVADTLYGTAAFMDKASAIFGGVQVISQIRKNQHLRFQGKTVSVMTLFQRYPGVAQAIRIRGGEEVLVWVSSARVSVCAHAIKRFVIALKYDGEDEYRYLVASDLSWRTLDIAQAHTLRWLVEVFFEDWKSYEGWGQLTKQPDEDGSCRSVTLSLLCDHCLLLHPEQLARFEHHLPACTVGSVCDVIKMESLMQYLWEVVSSADPQQAFQKIAARAKEIFRPASSAKHLGGRDLGRLEPTPTLAYRAQVVLKAA